MRAAAVGATKCPSSGRLGAPPSRDVLREELMDQRLIAQAPAPGLALESNQHLGVDANGDELSGDRDRPSSRRLVQIQLLQP